MIFSDCIGRVFKDLLNFETGLIRDVFDTLDQSALIEGSKTDNQSLFIKLLSDTLFQSSSFGDEELSNVIQNLFTSFREHLWGQSLLVQIISECLVKDRYAVKLSLQSLKVPLFHSIVTQLSKQHNKRINPVTPIVKHPATQTLFLISKAHLICLHSLLRIYFHATQRAITSESILGFLNSKEIGEFIDNEDDLNVIVEIPRVQQDLAKYELLFQNLEMLKRFTENEQMMDEETRSAMQYLSDDNTIQDRHSVLSDFDYINKSINCLNSNLKI